MSQEKKSKSESESEDTSLASVVATLVTAGTLIAAFALLAAGVWWFWVIFIVGFAGLLPAGVQLAKWYESRQDPPAQTGDDPLESLRGRYASGEIDEAEFERRVERLLETGSETDIEQFHGTDRQEESDPEHGDRPNPADREFERELDRN